MTSAGRFVVGHVRIADGRVSAPIRAPGKEHLVTLRVDGAAVSSDASPWVPIGLLPAMRAGHDLHLPGPVSPRLMRAVPKVQRLYLSWFEGLHQIRVVEGARVASDGSTGVALDSSTGVASDGSTGRAIGHRLDLLGRGGFVLHGPEASGRADHADLRHRPQRGCGR